MTATTREVGRFDPPHETPMVQLLAPDGTRIIDPDYAYHPGRGATLLEQMVAIRRFDMEATALQRTGRIGLWAPLLGQEAVQVGAFNALGARDHVFGSHREHGLGWLMGLPIERILGIYAGCEMGDWDAEALRFHHFTMVIGANTLHAVGYAMGQARDARRDSRSRSDVTIVFHGDGAISEGDVNEAYIFAARYQAPIIFCCVNNQWAISEPVDVQSHVPLFQRAWGFGMPGVRVDGNDVFAVQSVISDAIEHAAAGEGPTLVEAVTYRMGAHTTSDDPTKYRTANEVEEWRAKDPIARLETCLRRENAWDDARQANLDQRMESYGATVRAAVNDIRRPKLAEIFDWISRESR